MFFLCLTEKWRFEMKPIICFGVYVLLGLWMAACSNSAEIILPDADEITELGASCTALETMQVEAWQTFDAEELRKVYTEDIIHFDGAPRFVGIDEVTHMAEGIFTTAYFSDWKMDVGESYISQHGCVGTWVNWEIFAGTEEDPALEFDYLEARDGKISFWRLFYDAHFGSPITEEEFLREYADAWSSGNVQKIMDFYANRPSLDDSLLGMSLERKNQIKTYVEGILALSPGMEWEVLIPYVEDTSGIDFAEEYPHPSTGGVFGIHVTDEAGNTCMVEAFLMLTPDDDGKIIDHQMFYNEETLVECGWVK
jgi:ketosteroid isomerase-like protein